jgi:6-phosphofructokinase 1
MALTAENTRIKNLGPRTVRSPLNLGSQYGDDLANFVPDDAKVRYELDVVPGRPHLGEAFFEKAGPREMLHFRPDEVRAAIVTCGGLCPGLNDVIRSVFVQLRYVYGVPELLGIQYGYQGMNPREGLPPVPLTHQMVERAHKQGGTILGSSRGPQPEDVCVDFLRSARINMLFCVGGDGTQRGAMDISREAERQGLKLAVVGIPKTIDNDIGYVTRTFGLATAVDEARKVLDCAHNEAKGAPNGISIVKLMGRDSGFIAALATLASQEVNFCLIPELPFDLEGPHGFLEALKARILNRGHAVIAVAEGAGQDLLGEGDEARDASGNVLHDDIGPFLKNRVSAWFRAQGVPVSIKYFDPSYIIRSVPANTSDSMLCDQLARAAVHAGMAGKTELVVGEWHYMLTHVPVELATAKRKKVNPESELWLSVLLSTGQPNSMRNAKA